MDPTFESQNQKLELPLLRNKDVSLYLKREDLVHPLVSGNKFRKLKYNLIEAKKQGYGTLLTFGGAFSNHILATAAAGQIGGFKTIGVIRGDELRDKWKQNPTLKHAHSLGMLFYFVDRDSYRDKKKKSFLTKLEVKFGPFYLLPEGGTNDLAIKGCEEIVTKSDQDFDFICCSVGTGGTLAGLINSSHHSQTVLGFTALKGDFLGAQVAKWVHRTNWKIEDAYHFGGYAKVNEELIRFMNNFKERTGIGLDPLYTGKMLFGLMDSVKNDRFAPKSKILAIHTGGLQGVKGMNLVLKKKNLPQIL